jgi:acyl-CoA reductase-like NAD-dependent aldehyde dehydrogenase
MAANPKAATASVKMLIGGQWREGGVIVNGTSTWRTDQLAYGGIKASGIGREGPHYAIREMTDERLVVFNL